MDTIHNTVFFEQAKFLLYKKVIKWAKKIQKLYQSEGYWSFCTGGRAYIFFLKKYYFYFLKRALTHFIDYIMTTMNVEPEAVEEARTKKNNIKGGFTKRIYAEIIGVKNTNTLDLAYFRENNARYSEIFFYVDELEAIEQCSKYVYFSCHKLVRDNIIGIDSDPGFIVFYKELDRSGYKYAVTEKLIEELTELCEARTKVHSIEEIGDVYDILALLQEL